MAKITTKVDGQEIVIEGETADEAMRLYRLFHKLPGYEANWSLKEPIADANPEPEITSEIIPTFNVGDRVRIMPDSDCTHAGQCGIIEELYQGMLSGECARLTLEVMGINFGVPVTKLELAVPIETPRPNLVISEGLTEHGRTPIIDTKAVLAEASVREVTNLPESEWKASPAQNLKGDGSPVFAEGGHVGMTEEQAQFVAPLLSKPPIEKAWVPTSEFQGQSGGRIVSGSQVAAMNLGFNPSTDAGKTRGQSVAESAFMPDAYNAGMVAVFLPTYPNPVAARWMVENRDTTLAMIRNAMATHIDAEIARQQKKDIAIADEICEHYSKKGENESAIGAGHVGAAIMEGHS